MPLQMDKNYCNEKLGLQAFDYSKKHVYVVTWASVALIGKFIRKLLKPDLISN